MEKQKDEQLKSSHFSYKRSSVPARAFLIALGVIAFIFSTYELVERLWLTEIDMKLLHLFHIIRGISTSVVVGFLVGWYILKASPSIFPSVAAEISQLPMAEYDVEDRGIHFNLWFVRMRWLACVVATVLITLTVKVLEYLEEELFWPLILSVVCLAGTNVLYTLCIKRRWFIRYLRELQIGLDLVILTVLLHFSGGIENPLFFIYIFHVIIGGILLSRRWYHAIVGVASCLFTAMALAEMSGIINHYTLLVFPHLHSEGGANELMCAAHQPLYVLSMVGSQIIILCLTAYFTTTIMERLRSQERHVQAVRQRLERVVQASGAGFTILDRELRPVWLNDRIKDWLNLSDDIIGQANVCFTDWMGGENGPAAQTFKDGEVRVVERQRIGTAGNKHFFQVTVAPLLDNTGEVYQVVELTQDITERKLLEAEMLHSAKMAVLGEMAAGVAHEVGNPLASISTRLRLLKEEHDEDFLQQSVHLLEREISRISRILHGVSQLARPAKNGWNNYHINSIVSETLNMLRLHRGAKRCRIHAELVETIPDTTGSKDELVQVLLNLGLNAIEAMPNGGTLTVRTSAAAGEIRVSFADTGEGMSEEVYSKIFTPFFTSKENGLGLGLCIAHSIISAHDGRIEVQSKPGAGSVITVVLPIRATKAPVDINKAKTRNESDGD